MRLNLLSDVIQICCYQWLNSARTAFRNLSGVPPPEIAVPRPKVVVPPPGFVLMVHTGKSLQLLPPTRGHILRLKCTKFYFRWGSAPDPAGGT